MFVAGEKIARGNSFNRETGELEKKNTIVLNKEKAETISLEIKNNKWTISDRETKPKTQNPYPPFITSTLQQEGIRKLHMNSNRIMGIAQSLYEGGYITYMRTDSIHLSNEALNADRKSVV